MVRGFIICTFFQNIIREIKLKIIRWAGHVAWVGRRILLVKLEGKRPLGRPGCRWKDPVKISLKETEWKCAD
jgi:hypothetical protein